MALKKARPLDEEMTDRWKERKEKSPYVER
jgi:hypothetical protein